MRKTALLAVLIATVMVVPIAAYAIHSFTDVPDGAFFHNSVTWMKDNGITVGCNPPDNTKYCPNDDVTRGEMAVLMKRLSENKVVDAATAVDADKVDGFDATSLVRAAGSATDNPAGTNGIAESVSIEAPVDGMLFVSAVAEATDSGSWFCNIILNGDKVPEAGYTINVASNGNRVACPTSMTLAVPAGNHTVDLEIGSLDGDLAESSLSVIFIPFGADGTQPTLFTLSGQSTSGSSDDDEN